MRGDNNMKYYFDKDRRGRDLLVVEDAKIIQRWSNFRGLPGRYNAEGNRNFDLVIPEEMVDGMRAAGWNIRETKGSEEYPSEFYTNVNISWAKFPPSVIFYSGREDTRGTEVDETVIGQLDTAEIERMDLAINLSYRTKDDGSTGIKGYVQSMDVWLYQDPIRARRQARMGEE